MIDLDSTDWTLFSTWATVFYSKAIKVCLASAGGDSPEIFRALLDRSLPSLLELYEIWRKDKSTKAE